jgi:hypothetical protein
MRLECKGDWDGVIATFAIRGCELYGTGTVFDGKKFRVRMMASFEFEPGTAKIICERPITTAAPW